MGSPQFTAPIRFKFPFVSHYVVNDDTPINRSKFFGGGGQLLSKSLWLLSLVIFIVDPFFGMRIFAQKPTPKKVCKSLACDCRMLQNWSSVKDSCLDFAQPIIFGYVGDISL